MHLTKTIPHVFSLFCDQNSLRQFLSDKLLVLRLDLVYHIVKINRGPLDNLPCAVLAS